MDDLIAEVGNRAGAGSPRSCTNAAGSFVT
jgi:hypothetical protein